MSLVVEQDEIAVSRKELIAMLLELNRLERFSHEMRDRANPRIGLGDGERASLSHARIIADAIEELSQ